MADTAEHNALPTKIMEALEAIEMISHPAVMGMVMLNIVLLRPQMAQRGEEIGALNIATSGTMEPATKTVTVTVVASVGDLRKRISF